VEGFVEGLPLRRDRLDAQPRQRALELVLDHADAAPQRLEGIAGFVALRVVIGGGKGALQVVEHLQHGPQRRGAGLRGAAALLFGGAATHVLQLGGGAQEAVVGLLLLLAERLQFLAERLHLGSRFSLFPVLGLLVRFAALFTGRFLTGGVARGAVGGGSVFGGSVFGRRSGRFRIGVRRVAVRGGFRQGAKEVGEK